MAPFKMVVMMVTYMHIITTYPLGTLHMPLAEWRGVAEWR